MIYLDIVDEIERKNIKNVISEFDRKNIILESNKFETEKEKNDKIKKCKIIICDDNQNKINHYKSLRKTVIIFIKKRKSKKLIDELYLQKNTYTYSRKIELKEILKIQLSLEDKIHTLKMVLVSVATILLIVTFSNTFIPKTTNDSIFSKLKNQNIKVKLKPSKKELMKYENIVFLGDSITENYDLNKYFEQMPVVNSGASGYSTDDILAVIKDKVYIYNPTKVVILLGINDMNKYQDDTRLIENIKKITDNIKKNRPKSEIYIESIYPVDRERYRVLIDNNVDNNRIRNVNQMIKTFCEENKYTYIDMFDTLNNQETDSLTYEYSKDGLHLSDEGYKLVTEKIKTVIENNV